MVFFNFKKSCRALRFSNLLNASQSLICGATSLLFLGPTKPRNVTATVNKSTVIVKWLPPKTFQIKIRHYFVSWERDSLYTFHRTKVLDSPFIHDFGSKCNEA